MVLTVAYALSPIDLIPDIILVLGYFDDLIIVPVGIALAIRLMPENVLDEYRERAKTELAGQKIHSWTGLLIIILIWAFVLFLFMKMVVGFSLFFDSRDGARGAINFLEMISDTGFSKSIGIIEVRSKALSSGSFSG